jgi:orotidine-5'-phosphate decarboxylase
MGAIDKFNFRADEADSLLCVGLDPQIDKMPSRFRRMEFPLFAFNQYIIELTHEFTAAFKPNIAFYESHGAKGVQQLQMTLDFLKENHPSIFTICDAKRGDIGNTNQHYIRFIYDELGFDAITLHPYLGKEALQPFLDRKDKASIILCRTSNGGSGEIQDLVIEGKPLWEHIAQKVAWDWNFNSNCMMVVAATYPRDIKRVRNIAGEMTFLIPGVGAQGGEVIQAVNEGLNHANKGIIINSSRGIIYAVNPSEEARNLRDTINMHRIVV